jgi:hypothetical protein
MNVDHGIASGFPDKSAECFSAGVALAEDQVWSMGFFAPVSHAEQLGSMAVKKNMPLADESCFHRGKKVQTILCNAAVSLCSQIFGDGCGSGVMTASGAAGENQEFHSGDASLMDTGIIIP